MSVVLDVLLKPLVEFLKVPDLVELSAVRPKEVWLEIANQGYNEREAPELSYEYWQRLCYILSNYDGRIFDPKTQPRVSARLPGGHRFEAMVGQTVDESELSVSIRLRRNVQITLSDFGLPEFLQTSLISAMEEGQSIIISGGTSSGKTTFLNRLLQYIPPHKRVLSVEDTRELDIQQKQRVSYVVSRNEARPTIDWHHVIDHLMRSRPDLIIAGELSIANTFPLISLLDTGHRGFMTTVHSNTCRLAIEKTIPKKVALSGHPSHDIADFLKDTVDWVIQINKVEEGTNVKRQVTEVWQPQTGYTWHWQAEKSASSLPSFSDQNGDEGKKVH